MRHTDPPRYDITRLVKQAEAIWREGDSLSKIVTRLRGEELRQWRAGEQEIGMTQKIQQKDEGESVPLGALREVHARLDQLFDKIAELQETLEKVEASVENIDETLEEFQFADNDPTVG